MNLGTNTFSPICHMIHEAQDDVQAQVLCILLLRFAPSEPFHGINALHMVRASDNADAMRTNLGRELNDTFEHILTVHVAVIVHVEVDHETWVPRDKAYRLQQQLPSITFGRSNK